MPACVDQELLLGGLVDNELDAANVALVEAHITRCESCREEFERLLALRTLLRGDRVRHTAPEGLSRQISNKAKLSPVAANENRLMGFVASGLVGAVAASFLLVVVLPPGADSIVDQELVSSHVRSLQPGHLTDVQTTNQHVVKPWFNGKIDFAPPVPELARQGFPLAGGRLDSIEGKTVAAIVYHRRLHTVNLFVWPAKSARERTSVENGFAVSEWSDDGLRFAAVSDISSRELGEFKADFRAESRQAQR